MNHGALTLQKDGSASRGSLLSAGCAGHVLGSDNQTESPLYQREVGRTLLLKRHSIEFQKTLNLGGPMKRVFLFTLLSVVFALLLTGCGSGNNKLAVTPGSGNVT